VRRNALLGGLCLLLVALAAPAAARASELPVVVQVKAPGGQQVVVSGEGALNFPKSGRLVRAESVKLEQDALVFTGISLLAGRITADQLVVPTQGFGPAGLASLRVEGKKRAGLPNQVIPLADGGYVIAQQESVDGRQRELAGLLIHLGRKTGSLEAGTEILIGVPADRAVDAPPGGYTYPLGVQGEVIGCPFVPGSTHSPFIPPDNLPSDNAVDIAVPVGTPVLAVTAGVIGPQIGALDSSDPRMAGLRLHLDTPGVRFYYAHLSEIDVQAGQYVQAGQQLGLSGSANGAAHLHFAQDVGNPAETVGAPEACPFYQAYSEPWD
jgi:hypothetical protein